MGGYVKELRRRLRYCGRFVVYVWKQFQLDDCRDTAAALTYQTLFAVVPLATVSYSMINAISAFEGLESKIEDYVFRNFVPASGSTIQHYLNGFSSQARDLTAIGILFLAITAFLMLVTIERAFNEIWRAEQVRSGIQRVVLYWAVLTLGPPLVGFAIVITAYIYSLPIIAGVVSGSGGSLALIPAILTVLAFTLVYGAVPNCRVPLLHAFIGGVASAIVFEIAKIVFGIVMSRGSWQVIYGTFAAVPLFLIWVYLSWNIILAGAEVVRALSVYEDDDKIAAEPHLFQILAILQTFHEAHQQGRVLTERDLFHGNLHVSQEYWAEYRRYLMKMRLIQQVDKGGFVLSQDLRSLTVWDLQTQLPWPIPREGVLLNTEWKKELSGLLATINQNNREQLDIDLVNLFQSRR